MTHGPFQFYIQCIVPVVHETATPFVVGISSFVKENNFERIR